MICYLIRHAQTEWNSQNRIQGSSDIALSELGIEQAKRLALYMSDKDLGGLFSSSLIRAKQTASFIADKLDMPLKIKPELVEMHLGLWEGLTPDEVNDRYDKAYDLWRVSPTKVTIPQGETHDSFRERIRNGLSRILGSSNGKDLAVVTHGGPIASLISDWLLADYDRVIRRVVIDNAGVTIVEFRSDRPVIRSINSTAHLQGLPVYESHLFTSKSCP